MCALNPYFPNYKWSQEQDVLQDCIIELIKQYGYDIKYLPRKTVSIDDVFTEDALHKFDLATDVEVYVKNIEGFEGQGDILGKFGLEIRDTITFTIARRRWDQLLTPKLVMENGANYQDESA